MLIAIFLTICKNVSNYSEVRAIKIFDIHTLISKIELVC